MRFNSHAKLVGFGKALKSEPEENLINGQDEAEALTGTEAGSTKNTKAAIV